MKYTKEIEEIVWELHGQHQADYHMEFDEDIKRDLKKSIDQLQALIDRVVREERRYIKCDCVCHFEPESYTDTAEGKVMGCGTCDFTGTIMNQWGGRTPAILGYDYEVTGKCLMKLTDSKK